MLILTIGDYHLIWARISRYASWYDKGNEIFHFDVKRGNRASYLKCIGIILVSTEKSIADIIWEIPLDIWYYTNETISANLTLVTREIQYIERWKLYIY